MTTPDENAPELTAEARGEAPGRGRLIGRRILVHRAGSARFQGESDPPGNGQAIARLAALAHRPALPNWLPQNSR